MSWVAVVNLDCKAGLGEMRSYVGAILYTLLAAVSKCWSVTQQLSGILAKINTKAFKGWLEGKGPQYCTLYLPGGHVLLISRENYGLTHKNDGLLTSHSVTFQDLFLCVQWIFTCFFFFTSLIKCSHSSEFTLEEKRWCHNSREYRCLKSRAVGCDTTAVGMFVI